MILSRAFRILLDHGVKEKNIIFLTYLVSRIGGIHQVLANHPDIRIQTSAVDDGLEERTEIDPTTKKLRKVSHYPLDSIDY